MITLSVDVEGYLRASEISSGRVEDATTVLKAGENIEAMIVNIDRKARSIQLSIKARDNAETAETIPAHVRGERFVGYDELGRAAQGQAGPTAQRRLT
ncbi:S1 RNA-binding domain-containing protein [Bordetella pertussis]|uniref:S1 RNA-binding domain-containing protein n=1 Tax=Bordetella pertussis TaxID=520 RepID=UPI000A910876|nr:S1 RNA-binding domain-containing protein [Bordetella pertussis]